MLPGAGGQGCCMTQLYTIGLLALVLSVFGLIAYMLVRRIVLELLEWDRQRRLAQWSIPLARWLEGESEIPPEEIQLLSSRRDLKIMAAICMGQLRTGDERIRARLVQWLQDHGFVTHWIEQVGGRSRWERARAVETLGVLRAPEAESTLVSALQDPVFDVRIRAAKALGSLGGQQARRALVMALGDESRWSVIRIADILAQMGPHIVTDLVEAFPVIGSGSRIAALDIIIRLADPSHLPFLRSCLAAPDSEIRARAVAGLGRLGDASILPGLLDALQDLAWPVRAKAAKALGELGLADAVPALAASLADKEWWVRSNAAEALRKLGRPGIDALVNSLSSSDLFCRDQAFAALQSSGDLHARLMGLVAKNAQERARAQAVAQALIRYQSRHCMLDVCNSLVDPDVRSVLYVMLQQQPEVTEVAV